MYINSRDIYRDSTCLLFRSYDKIFYIEIYLRYIGETIEQINISAHIIEKLT